MCGYLELSHDQGRHCQNKTATLVSQPLTVSPVNFNLNSNIGFIVYRAVVVHIIQTHVRNYDRKYYKMEKELCAILLYEIIVC